MGGFYISVSLEFSMQLLDSCVVPMTVVKKRCNERENVIE